MADELTYQQQVALMRQDRHERERQQRVNEIEQRYNEVVQDRAAAVEAENLDSYDWADTEIEQLENEYSRLQPPAPPQSPFTEVEQSYLRKHSVSDLQRPHWSGLKSPDGRPLSTFDALVGGSGYATNNLGLDRDSRAYAEALEVLGPIEKTGVPDADEILKTINATSKYGVSAKTYNKNVERLYREKAKGGYPDR